MNKPTDNQQFNVGLTGKVVIGGVEFNADSIERIQACLDVCEGISTSVLQLNATAGGVATLERQRDAVAAALKIVLGKAYKQNWNDLYPEVLAQAEAALEWDKSDLPTTVTAVTAFQPTARYTSISKGGSYERMGAIRGAGSLKGLSGIAYRDDKGSLFIREPECFAKRMVLIKADGGAQ